MSKKKDSKLKTMILATRPWSFSLTIISVLIGTFIVSPANVNWIHFILVLSGMVILHGATNVLNDYFDYKNGVDFEGAPTTLYRKHPLVSGAMLPRGLFLESLFLYGIAGIIGIYLIIRVGWPVAVFAAIGGFASVFYTGWFINFKYRAMGEIAVFLIWGPVMIFASFFLQAESWEKLIPIMLISIPHGLWVTLVILANNLKDIEFDLKLNIRTVGSVLKKKEALRLYTVLGISLYLCTGILIGFRILPLWNLLVIISIPKTIGLIKQLYRAADIPADADPMTAQAGTIFGVLFVASLILGQLFPLW